MKQTIIESDNRKWLGPFTLQEIETQYASHPNAILWWKGAPSCGWQTPHHCHAISKELLFTNSFYNNNFQFLQNSNEAIWVMVDEIGVPTGTIHKDTPLPKNIKPEPTINQKPINKKSTNNCCLVCLIIGLILGALLGYWLKRPNQITCPPQQIIEIHDTTIRHDTIQFPSVDTTLPTLINNDTLNQTPTNVVLPNGKEAKFLISILTQEFKWKLGSYTSTEDGIQVDNLIATVISQYPSFNKAKALIAVGVASQENNNRDQEEWRAYQRSETIIKGLNATIDKPKYRLELGQYLDKTTIEYTNSQRPVLIISVIESDEMTNDEKSKACRKARESINAIDIHKYSKFKFVNLSNKNVAL